MRTLLLLLLAPLAGIADDIAVTADFPNGSCRVEEIDQKARIIKFQPTTHKDRGWVCWWYLKVTGVPKGETVTLDLGSNTSFATPGRAMFSTDNKTWKHTAPGKKVNGRMIYQHVVDSDTIWFAWGPPFTLEDANQLLKKCAERNKHATIFELAKSADGRSVPAIKIEEPGVKDSERLGIWIQARQHAWESGGSWVGKGLIDWLLSDDDAATALRKKSTIIFVPIMDVDNVERGAGGKNQVPHDHNRDWIEQPVFPAVLAAQKKITEMHQAGRMDFFIDLHNPAPDDGMPFFFVSPPEMLTPRGRQNTDNFVTAVRKEMVGPMKLSPNTRPSGPAYDKNWKAISKNWVSELTKNHAVSVTLETTWNSINSTAEGYQKVGEQLGRGMERYFREPTREPVK